MAERPKNYDKWAADINAKIGDYLRLRGYDLKRVDFESGWLGIARVEFGLGRDRAQEWGFTSEELNKVNKMLDKVQAELDSRTIFYRGGTISGPNPYATPESEVRRRCQERLGNLDNILHMWDIFAIIGGGPGMGARPKPQRRGERPRFDLFHGLRDSTSSEAISSMKAQRARARYEAFDDTAKLDKSPENKPELVLSDAKTNVRAKPQQGKGPGSPYSPSPTTQHLLQVLSGKGSATEPALGLPYSKKCFDHYGRRTLEKAAKLGLREKDLEFLTVILPEWVMLSRIDKLAEKGGNIRQEIETEMKMVDHLKDKLCGGSLKETKAHLKSGEDVWGAIHEKILDNLWNEWRTKQTDRDALIKMPREERNQLARSFNYKAREKTNQIMADLSGSKRPEVQTPLGGGNIPPKIEESPPPSAEKTPSGEANVPGPEGPEVQTPPGGANLPAEIRNKPPRPAEKPPPKEMSKPPSIEIDIERPPMFPIIFPTREPGSENFPMKEPQSIPPPSETPPTDDSDELPQSVAPGHETLPTKEPQSIPPPGETSQFTFPPLPSESKSWSLPSTDLSPHSESAGSNFAEFAGTRVEGYSTSDDSRQNGGDAGYKPPVGRDESGGLPESEGGTDSQGNAGPSGSEDRGEYGGEAGYKPPEGRDESGGLPKGENREAEAQARTPEVQGGGVGSEVGGLGRYSEEMSARAKADNELTNAPRRERSRKRRG